MTHVTPHAERRLRLLADMGERSVAVIFSAPVAIRNNDVEHFYRQDSDFFYLTGLDEPDSVLVLSPAHAEHGHVLFVRPRDPVREVWDGPRTGVEGAVSDFGADAAFEVGELAKRLPEYLADTDQLFYRVGLDPASDAHVFAALDAARRKHRFGTDFPSAIIEPGRLLHEYRLAKDDFELDAMRRAASVTEDAHLAAMQVAKPGAFEFEVEAAILQVFRAAGSERPAYSPICGSGPNATILHHRKNDRKMLEGELLLIDAGCELDYYASDVTRTFPVSGTYTAEQRAVYDVVLKTQEACIDAVKPGATVQGIHEIAVRETTEGLVALGLIEGTVENAIDEALYKPFYMHRTSHWLGMDVHDVGSYSHRGEDRGFEPGFVLTVEPGIYIGVNAEVDEKWRGIGIRIEDDILVTADGHENLTAAIPKDPKEVEEILASR